MKSPKAGNNLPDFSGQSKILFFNEGNPVAILVTRRVGQQKAINRRFDSGEAALAWCRRNTAILVYCPVALERN
jgi:hypothetical protein